MKLTVRVPELPEGVEIDATRLSKALRWALQDGWEPGAVWQVNNVPAIAQLEELVFQDGQAGLSELFEAVSKQLGLPSNAETLSLLAKGRVKGHSQPGQLGFSFDEEKHPRLSAGGTQGEYKPGEFIPKDDKPAEQSYQDAYDKLVAWNYFVDSVRDAALNHRDGDERKTLPELKEFLDRLRSESANYESGVTSTVRDASDLKGKVKERVALVEKRLEKLIGELEADEARRKAEPPSLTPEQRVALQFQGWADNLHHARERLAQHLTGEAPQSRVELERASEYFTKEFEHYDRELTAASRNPDSKEWFSTSDDHRLTVLARLSRTIAGNFLSEIQRKRAEDFMPWHEPGWEEMLQQASQLEQDALIAGYYYDWAAEHKSDAEGWDAGRDLRQKADDTRRDLNAKAKKLKAKANKEKREAAKFFKEQPNTGVGFTRQQQAYDREDAPHQSKWKWVDLTGQVPGSGASNPMSQEKWDAIQAKHAMPDLPPNFFYMGPTDAPRLQGEAQRAAERFVKRVPSWLMNRIADNGGEYVFSAPPPYRLGFKTQAEYDEWIGKQGRKSIKDNDPRHWDDVGGFYRHADKKAYSQVGDSGQRGTVDLELHEFGHMVDYLFNGGQGSNRKTGAISETPEFKSIWKNLHPWLDDYMTKDHDAAELFAEGFAVFSESEENRRRMLSKDTPEPMQRLGRFFERFLKEGNHEQVAKSLWVAFGKACDHMNKAAERHARGRVTENGKDLRWDDGHFDEQQEERHEHFPTLFLKTPRKAEKDKNDGE